ncbi:MAG: hypothetical protein KatS3mg043_0630 [Rhodothermaceae bacterium]|nr:MAG: hypothetical protein KatS3mg043_0630 [Rhodothermaceae bacterium]
MWVWTCPVGEEEVEVGVEVEVGEEEAEGEGEQGGVSDAGGSVAVEEEAVAGVAVDADHFFGEVADEEGGMSGGVDDARVDAHARPGLAVVVEGDAAGYPYFSEGAVAVVFVEQVAFGVVGDGEVGPAVVVVVELHHAEGFVPCRFDAAKEAGLGGAFGEGAVAVVAVETAGNARVFLGGAVRFFAVVQAHQILFGGPVDVVGHEQVEVAVPVGVEEEGGACSSRP